MIMKISFKLPADSTIYSYTGSWESFNAIYPKATVLKKESEPIWDEDLKMYV